MAKSTFKYVTYIRTTPEKLWHALTTTEVIKQYWFGMRVDSDWKVGSTWRFYYDDRLMDSGEILESAFQKRLVRSWLNEWKREFKAEGSSHCVCEMEPIAASVKLTITHSIERVNSRFIEALSEGWPMCISNLKSLLETGEVALADHPRHTE
ncbi:MAG TPA: SRPBCC family protein [Terriglobales bacterium]|jgi:uncharacterized protein YndB with AHSA1/START domain|nr:SRPBCC family protein [Terriglobales bacterium]